MDTTPSIQPISIKCMNTGCSFYEISGYTNRGYFDLNGDFRTLNGYDIGRRIHNLDHPQFKAYTKPLLEVSHEMWNDFSQSRREELATRYTLKVARSFAPADDLDTPIELAMVARHA